jgi:hypothetical protein
MHWEDSERIKARVSPEGTMTHVLWLLGALSAALGVISDAANRPIGLESDTWLLLAIALFAASAVSFIEWAVAWYLRTARAQ